MMERQCHTKVPWTNEIWVVNLEERPMDELLTGPQGIQFRSQTSVRTILLEFWFNLCFLLCYLVDRLMFYLTRDYIGSGKEPLTIMEMDE